MSNIGISINLQQKTIQLSPVGIELTIVGLLVQCLCLLIYSVITCQPELLKTLLLSCSTAPSKVPFSRKSTYALKINHLKIIEQLSK